MEDDHELRELVELAKHAHSEDELNTATLRVSDRYGTDITPLPAKKKLRELKLRSFLKRLWQIIALRKLGMSRMRKGK